MPTAFNRMRDEVALGLVAATFIIYIFILIPNYQQIAYQNTEARSYDWCKRYVGYPADEQYPTVSSIIDIKEKSKDTFTIRTEASKIEALDVYLDLDTDKWTTSGLARAWSMKCNERIGRLFRVQLENGEEIIILLDEQTINMPKKGNFTLPIGEYEGLKEGKFTRKLEEVSGIEEVSFIIDMAGDWRKGEESESFENVRCFIAVVVWVFFVDCFIEDND